MSYTHAVFYEIFVQSFADSNGDGIGDINGMTTKLDYLQDLGITAVWLMPLSPSPSYHKYDVTDYKAIHPDYGSMDDFKRFIKEAHQRGIRVIIDFVIHHSSSQHPWFSEAKKGPFAWYRNYYLWADKESIQGSIEKEETSMDSDNKWQWHPVDMNDTHTDYYSGFFHSGMPDLNFDNPAVREEVYSIGEFWLQEVGVDGFRMDAAKHIYPDERAEDAHAFWREFKAAMQAVKPDVYLIGEVWSDAKSTAPYAAGFSSLFNFDLSYSLLETVKNGDQRAAEVKGNTYKTEEKSQLIDILNYSSLWFTKYNIDFLSATFLSNHDQVRTASVLDAHAEKIKLAASILFTLPGTPYIYYGEEIGMLGKKPDENVREPMIWDEDQSDQHRTNWLKPIHSTTATIAPVSLQAADRNSVLNHYKSLIALKKTDVFSLGKTEKINVPKLSVLAFKRTYKDVMAEVYHNLSGKKVKITSLDMSSKVAFSSGQLTINGTNLTLGPWSSVVLMV